MKDRQLDPLPGLAVIVLLMAMLATLAVSTLGPTGNTDPTLGGMTLREHQRVPTDESIHRRTIVAEVQRRVVELLPTDMRTLPHGATP